MQEAVNRIQEKTNILYNTNHDDNANLDETHVLSNECDVDNITLNTNHEFTFFQTIKLSSSNYIISTHVSKNNYILLNTNEIAIVKNIFKCINGNIFLNVFTFKPFNFFEVPLESSMIGSVIVDIKSQHLV